MTENKQGMFSCCPVCGEPLTEHRVGICNIWHKQLDYSIALQRAIEAHCRGEMIDEITSALARDHARMLNENLKGPTDDRTDNR